MPVNAGEVRATVAKRPAKSNPGKLHRNDTEFLWARMTRRPTLVGRTTRRLGRPWACAPEALLPKNLRGIKHGPGGGLNHPALQRAGTCFTRAEMGLEL